VRLFPRRRRAQSGKAALLQALAQARTAKYRLEYWIRRIEAEGGDPKLLETLYFIDYVLEAIILRLNTLITLGGVNGALAGLPVALAREVTRHLEAVPPEVAASLSAITNILAESSLSEAALIEGEALDEKAREVLREAKHMAAEKARRGRGAAEAATG